MFGCLNLELSLLEVSEGKEGPREGLHPEEEGVVRSITSKPESAVLEESGRRPSRPLPTSDEEPQEEEECPSPLPKP